MDSIKWLGLQAKGSKCTASCGGATFGIMVSKLSSATFIILTGMYSVWIYAATKLSHLLYILNCMNCMKSERELKPGLQ